MRVKYLRGIREKEMRGQASRVAFSLVLVLGLILLGLTLFVPVSAVRREVNTLDMSSVLLNNINPLLISSLENLSIVPLEVGGLGENQVRVTDTEGNPISKAYVWGLHKVYGYSGVWMTDENGIARIDPNFTLRIGVGKENYYPYLGEFRNEVVLRKFELTGDNYPTEFGVFSPYMGWVIFRGLITSDLQGYFENRIWTGYENALTRIQGSKDGICLSANGIPHILIIGGKVTISPTYDFFFTNGRFLSSGYYFENTFLKGSLKFTPVDNFWYVDSSFTFSGLSYSYYNWYSVGYEGSIFGKIYSEDSDLIFEGEFRKKGQAPIPIMFRVVRGMDLIMRFIPIPIKPILGFTGFLLTAIGIVGMVKVSGIERRR